MFSLWPSVYGMQWCIIKFTRGALKNHGAGIHKCYFGNFKDGLFNGTGTLVLRGAMAQSLPAHEVARVREIIVPCASMYVYMFQVVWSSLAQPNMRGHWPHAV